MAGPHFSFLTWFDAFREGDISKLQLAEDFVHTSPVGEIRGRQVYLDLVRENSEAFLGPRIEILDVIDGGDRFAVRYLVNENPACDCIYVRNGQISEIYSYYHVGEKPNLYDEWKNARWEWKALPERRSLRWQPVDRVHKICSSIRNGIDPHCP